MNGSSGRTGMTDRGGRGRAAYIESTTASTAR